MTLKLDANGDLERGYFAFNLITDKKDLLRQKLYVKLRLFLGEYYLNVNKGVPYFESVLIKNPNISNVSAIFKAQILSVQGVNNLTKFEIDFDPSTRKYSVDFSVDTIYGEISGVV